MLEFAASCIATANDLLILEQREFGLLPSPVTQHGAGRVLGGVPV